MIAFLIVFVFIFVVFLLYFLESQWVKDIRYNQAKYIKTPSREKIVLRQSKPTDAIENRTSSNESYFAKPSGTVNPSNWNYTTSSFSPSSITNAIREKGVYTNERQQIGISPYTPEPTFVKNQRMKGQRMVDENKSGKLREVSPDSIRIASDNYWNKVSPASKQNMKNEANYPTVIPSIVVQKVKKTTESATEESTATTQNKTPSLLPKKPNITTTDGAKPTINLATGAKVGSGISLGGTKPGGLNLGPLKKK